MERRMTQRIVECNDCGRIPEDGEYFWDMNGLDICERCIDTHGEEDNKGEEDE